MADQHQVNSIIATAIWDARKDHPDRRIDAEEAKQIAKSIVEALTEAGLQSQLLIYMNPDLVRQLKLAALAKQRPAYELAEEAIAEWLKRHQRDVAQATAKIARGEVVMPLPAGRSPSVGWRSGW